MYGLSTTQTDDGPDSREPRPPGAGTICDGRGFLQPRLPKRDSFTLPSISNIHNLRMLVATCAAKTILLQTTEGTVSGTVPRAIQGWMLITDCGVVITATCMAKPSADRNPARRDTLRPTGKGTLVFTCVMISAGAVVATYETIRRRTFKVTWSPTLMADRAQSISGGAAKARAPSVPHPPDRTTRR